MHPITLSTATHNTTYHPISRSSVLSSSSRYHPQSSRYTSSSISQQHQQQQQQSSSLSLHPLLIEVKQTLLQLHEKQRESDSGIENHNDIIQREEQALQSYIQNTPKAAVSHTTTAAASSTMTIDDHMSHSTSTSVDTDVYPFHISYPSQYACVSAIILPQSDNPLMYNT